MMDDDEDSFLYGDAGETVAPAQKASDNVVEVISVPAETGENHTNGVVAHLELEAEGGTSDEVNEQKQFPGNGEVTEGQDEGDEDEGGDEEEQEEEAEEEEESDEDIEFILEPPTRSLDFRSQRGGPHTVQPRGPSAAVSSTPAHATNLTTEYTPRERGAPPDTLTQPSLPGQSEIPQIPPATPAVHVPGIAVQPTAAQQPPVDEGPDPSTLPPVRAPPSHPNIDLSAPGTYEGRSIFDVDMTNLTEKPWRRPGSDISDWFNYGFDEISWEAYCYRRRVMGDMAGVLRANVLGFAGMQEEQLLALPPEARTMVMTGTNALMTGGGGPNGPPGVGVGPGMMPPVGMNPMGPMNPMMAAEMGGMGGMPMGVPMGNPMGMGMNGDMGVGMPGPNQGPGPMMQDGQVLGQGPNAAGPSGTPEQLGQMALPDGMPGGPPGMMSMGMSMGPDFGSVQMQDSNMQGPQIHPGMEPTSSATPTPVPLPPRVGSTPAAASFRGRGIAPTIPAAPKGARPVPTFPGRGRGATALPVRPASPLPPNVPTGPRNPGIRYKDRDNNAPAVEGLDYGGNKDGGAGTPNEHRDKIDRVKERERDRDRDVEEKPSVSRKRRSPPSNEEDRIGRSSKRR